MRGANEHNPTEYAERRRDERRFDRRVLVPAFAISALLHFLVFFTFSLEPALDRLPPPPTRVVDIDRTMRVYDVTPVATEVPPIDVQVREQEQRREVVVPESPWAAPPPAAAPPPDAASVRDRLRYRMGSREVWRPSAEERFDMMTPEEVVRARVASELQIFNDSVAAEEAARARALDWSFTDSEGRRWGIAPGRIYAGTDTIRIPFEIEFRPPPGRREEIAGRIRTFREIQQQAARVETQEVINERIRLIRERAEQERARNTGGGGADGGAAG